MGKDFDKGSRRKPASKLEARTLDRRSEQRRRSRLSGTGGGSLDGFDGLDAEGLAEIPSGEAGSTLLWTKDQLVEDTFEAEEPTDESFDDEPYENEDETVQMMLTPAAVRMPAVKPLIVETPAKPPPPPPEPRTPTPRPPPQRPASQAPERFKVQQALRPLLGRVPRFNVYDRAQGTVVELRELRGYVDIAPDARAEITALEDHFAAGGAPPDWCTVPGVVALSQVVRDPERGPVAVLPWTGGYSLAELEAPRQPEELADLAAVVAELHAAREVHGNLCPDLVVLDTEGQPWLDVLSARVLPPSFARRSAFVSPEVRAGQPATPASDVFSLSVMVAQALGGKVVEGEVSGVSAAQRALLARGLAFEPQDRCTATELRDGLCGAAEAPTGGGPRQKLLIGAIIVAALAALVGGFMLFQRPEAPACVFEARIEAAGGDPLCQAYLLERCVSAAEGSGEYATQRSLVMESTAFKDAVSAGKRTVRKKLGDESERLRVLVLLHHFAPKDAAIAFEYSRLEAALPKDPCP